MRLISHKPQPAAPGCISPMRSLDVYGIRIGFVLLGAHRHPSPWGDIYTHVWWPIGKPRSPRQRLLDGNQIDGGTDSRRPGDDPGQGGRQ